MCQLRKGAHQQVERVDKEQLKLKWLQQFTIVDSNFEKISAFTKCGQLSSVQLQNFTKGWCFCTYIMLL